jgi:hypothetical protein
MKTRQRLRRHLRLFLISSFDSFVLDHHFETLNKQRQRHACYDELDRFFLFSHSSFQRENNDNEDESDKNENDESENDESDEMISQESDFKN